MEMNTRTSRINTWMKMTLARVGTVLYDRCFGKLILCITLIAIMEGLQPWYSAALPIIARCCKSCSCEKSPFLSCCWRGHCTPFSSAMTWPWLHGVQCNSCSPSDTRSPCVFLAAHVLCLLLLLLHEELRGRPRAFLLKATQRTDPKNLNLFLTSHVFPVLGGVVWSVSVKDGAAECEWQSGWSCAVLLGDTSRADGSTADVLSEGDREHWWRYLQRKPCAPWRGLRKSWSHCGQ